LAAAAEAVSADSFDDTTSLSDTTSLARDIPSFGVLEEPQLPDLMPAQSARLLAQYLVRYSGLFLKTRSGLLHATRNVLVNNLRFSSSSSRVLCAAFGMTIQDALPASLKEVCSAQHHAH